MKIGAKSGVPACLSCFLAPALGRLISAIFPQYFFVNAHAGHGFRGNPSMWCPCITKARGGSNCLLSLQPSTRLLACRASRRRPPSADGHHNDTLGQGLDGCLDAAPPLVLHAAGLLAKLPDHVSAPCLAESLHLTWGGAEWVDLSQRQRYSDAPC